MKHIPPATRGVFSAMAATATARDGVSALLRLVAPPPGNLSIAAIACARSCAVCKTAPTGWPLDLTCLRNLDRDLLQDVLVVLKLDWHGWEQACCSH